MKFGFNDPVTVIAVKRRQRQYNQFLKVGNIVLGQTTTTLTILTTTKLPL